MNLKRVYRAGSAATAALAFGAQFAGFGAADETEPGVGDGLNRGRAGERTNGAHPQGAGCVHAGVPGAGEPDVSLGSGRVTRVLDEVIAEQGVRRARAQTMDQSSAHMLAWAEERKIALVHVQPGRPMQNG